jgi:hypothetical protein
MKPTTTMLVMASVLILGSLVWVASADDDDVGGQQNGPKEMGYIYQSTYGDNADNQGQQTSCEWPTLVQAGPFCTNLYSALHKYGGWTLHQDVQGGDASVVTEVEKYAGENRDKGDWVDLFVWSGHGPISTTTGGKLHFRTNHPNDSGRGDHVCSAIGPSNTAGLTDISLGEGDCEFAIFYTCNFLTSLNDADIRKNIKLMSQGTHAILGFSSYMDVWPLVGDRFAKYAVGINSFDTTKKVNPLTVKQAWFKACDDYMDVIGEQDEHVIAAAVLHTSCESDYLRGNWKWEKGCQMSPDDSSSTNPYKPPRCNLANLNEFVIRKWDCHTNQAAPSE